MSRLHERSTRRAGAASADLESGRSAPETAAESWAVPVPGRIVDAPQEADPLGGTAVESSVATALRRRQGAGRPLPDRLAQGMEQHLGHDLSAVRVHTDPEAGRITSSLQAVAFTHGNDLYFARGAYQPTTDRGLHVLAHEVGHVVAQRSGLDRGGSGALTIGRADDPAERLADRTAESTLAALRRRSQP